MFVLCKHGTNNTGNNVLNILPTLFEWDKWSLCTQNSWGDKPHGTDRSPKTSSKNFMCNTCAQLVWREEHISWRMRVPKITPPKESSIWQCSYRKFLFFSRVLLCKRSQMEGLFRTWNGWLVFSFWPGLKNRCASCIMEHAQYRVYIYVCALVVVRCLWGIWVVSAKLSKPGFKMGTMALCPICFKTECFSWFAQWAWWIF